MFFLLLSRPGLSLLSTLKAMWDNISWLVFHYLLTTNCTYSLKVPFDGPLLWWVPTLFLMIDSHNIVIIQAYKIVSAQLCSFWACTYELPKLFNQTAVMRFILVCSTELSTKNTLDLCIVFQVYQIGSLGRGMTRFGVMGILIIVPGLVWTLRKWILYIGVILTLTLWKN